MDFITSHLLFSLPPFSLLSSLLILATWRHSRMLSRTIPLCSIPHSDLPPLPPLGAHGALRPAQQPEKYHVWCIVHVCVMYMHTCPMNSCTTVCTAVQCARVCTSVYVNTLYMYMYNYVYSNYIQYYSVDLLWHWIFKHVLVLYMYIYMYFIFTIILLCTMYMCTYI